MPRQSPFHPRTSALCHSLAWKEWSGYAAVCNYDAHSEREYFAIRHTVGLLDVTPLYKYEIKGPDAAAFLARLWTRDIRKYGVGRVTYCCMCDPDGKVLDDGTVAHLAKDHFRVSSSMPWMHWFHRFARGYDVQIEDSTNRIAALALQGPNARKVLKPIVEFDMDRMRFFRVRRTRLAGIDVWISRTGYTGDLGYEIWMDNADALTVWDALMESGKPHGLEPIGLDALDVSRIEAGFVLQGIDYVSARSCVLESRKSTPLEAGLGWTVDLERSPPFVGQAALLKEREVGPAWDLVGLEISWEGLEGLYDEYGLPPHLSPHACRDGVPVYDMDGQQLGMVTSQTWSPVLKKMLALATLPRARARVGAKVQVEHTIEFERRKVEATVVEKPFFDPERKRSTPAATKKPQQAAK